MTSIARKDGSAAALRWLNGVKANAGSSHLYPDNETVVDEVNRGQVALGVINQYYWYRLRAEDGASKLHSAIAYFAPHDVGYVIDVSGAGVLSSSQHAAEAQKLVAFLSSRAGSADHRPQRQLRVPDRVARHDGPTGDPVRPAAAEFHHHRPARHGCHGDQAVAGGPAVVSVTGP